MGEKCKMNMEMVIVFISGFLSGVIISVLFFLWQQKQSAGEKELELQRIKEAMKESFSALSAESLNQTSDQFLKLAKENFSRYNQQNADQLEGKKALINQSLDAMKGELGKVNNLVEKMGRERQLSFGKLSQHLQNSVQQTQILQEQTQKLNQALSSSQVRGQWGERMAEDVLRMAGLVEGINYKKQSTIASGARPDFTFLLPNNLLINMDVKFPLNNYMAYLEAEHETEREKFKIQFLRDTRARVKEVTSRDYINTAEKTLDYMLVFIPNEQIYSFINQHDHTLLDEAMQKKVILCSPVSLYAILAVIRQAVENFNLEQTATEILNLLAEFNGQWQKYKDKMERMGNRIEAAQKEFNELQTTRSTQLEKPLNKIEFIKQNRDHKLGEGGSSLS